MTTPLPARLHLEVTNRCNSLCTTCIRTFGPDPERDLTVDEIDRITGELPGLRSVALQVNGDPLLHPELPDIVRRLEGRDVRVELNTNAIALRGRIAAELLDCGLSLLNISIDGTDPQTYWRLRGVDALARVIANTRAFLTARGPAPALPRVSLWMVASQANVLQLLSLVELCAQLGAEEVYLQRLVFFGDGQARAEDSLHDRLTEQQRQVIDAACARANELGVSLRASGGYSPAEMLQSPAESEPWRSCRRPREGAVVMANGDVVPCCISTFVAGRDDIVMGNVLDTDWQTVWNGEAYARLRATQAEGPGPELCRQCGVCWSL